MLIFERSFLLCFLKYSLNTVEILKPLKIYLKVTKNNQITQTINYSQFARISCMQKLNKYIDRKKKKKKKKKKEMRKTTFTITDSNGYMPNKHHT